MPEDTKVVSLSDEELTHLKFIGPSAVQSVIDLVATIKKGPEYFDWFTVSHLACFKTHVKYHPASNHSSPASSSSSTFSDPTRLSNLTKTTAAADDLVTPVERVHFYHGISEDPPPLLHRSDVKERPYIISNERYSTIPIKTAHTANHPVLKNELWKFTVAPKIIELLNAEDSSVHVTSMLPVRFSTANEEGEDVFDDYVVLWISVRPDSTKETSCRASNTPIIAIFAQHNIEDIAVHWIEGTVESLVRPPSMMAVASEEDPTYYIRRALTATLSVPLAAEELEDGDSQGCLGLYFHEGKDQHGNESNRVMAITNKHVVSRNIHEDYQYSGRPAAPKQHIRNCGRRRFEQVTKETNKLITTTIRAAQRLAEECMALSKNPPSDDDLVAQEVVRRKHENLRRAKADVIYLTEFLEHLKSSWSYAYQQIIGHVDWAPSVANNLNKYRYTRDIAVITLDEDKLLENFKGNSVYLAGKFAIDEIESYFNPGGANPTIFRYPDDHLFRLSGFVNRADLWNPPFVDERRNPCTIVAKDGQATDLTFGRQSELEAYTCRDVSGHSWEVAVFNYNKKPGDFASRGDSGAAIFNAKGKIVTLLHSAIPRGFSNHVTFGTPGYYVEELIKEHYPHADFSRLKFA